MVALPRGLLDPDQTLAVVKRVDGSMQDLRPPTFTAVCAFVTKDIHDLALGLPVIALLIALLRCEVQRYEAPS